MLLTAYDIGCIEKVKDLIAKDLRVHHPARALADVAGMGQTRLKELFKLHTGTNLYAYLCNKRMEAATEQLIYSNQNLKSITRACGYRHYTNFAKAFKLRYGLTPKNYRNLYRNQAGT